MTAEHVLSIENLIVVPSAGGRPVVDNASLRISPGEVVALIGESGSGKSTMSLACLGHVRTGLRVQSGRVRLGGADLFAMDPAALPRIRGREVAYIAQSAAASFNPGLRLNAQVTEPSRIHRTRSAGEALQRAVALYRQLGLPSPETIGERYPHEVSGGQLQRFMVAMGMMEQPKLLIFDEPTSALDVTTQVEVLAAMRAAVQDGRTAALFVSHDLPVVAQMADRIVVLHHGRMVEEGATSDILDRPREPYTQSLVAAFHSIEASRAVAQAEAPAAEAPLLEIANLTAGYGRGSGGQPAVKAVQDVSLRLRRGRIVAVVGESGSGKSSLAQVIAGLLPASSGDIRLGGVQLGRTVAERTHEQLRQVQLLFQMADTALNPYHTVARILGRVLSHFGRAPRSEHRQRIAELLRMVQLPAHYADRRSSQLSGGEKQRVNLARALAAEPDVLICDEITSALDTVVGAAILKLIEDLRDRLGLAVIFISHDLPKVASIADEVMVMRHGHVVEHGVAGDVLLSPKHPYTRLLVESVPELRVGWLDRVTPRLRALAAELEITT